MKNLAHNLLRSYSYNFPSIKGKRRVLAALWKPLSFGKYQRRGRLKQADIMMNCDLTKEIQRQIYFLGGYEEEWCELWSELAATASTIFDVGANVGVYSLLAAQKRPMATIHSFEPTPTLAEAVSANAKLNGLNNIVVNVVAVGQEHGQAFLHRCVGSTQSNEGMNFVSEATQDDFDVATEVISLDDYCRDRGILSVDLVKMDIEGSEYNALLGSKALLQGKAIGCLLLELSEWAAQRGGHSVADIRGLLKECGYQIYTLRSKKLERVGDHEDIDNTNVLAFASIPTPLASKIN